MRFFQRETSAYAVLLIVLFAIAAVAVSRTLDYIGAYISGEELRLITMAMSALTLGFMFIAGAFGLWAIRFSAEGESRRRIGSLVESMDYLKDGLIAIDNKGRITSFSPIVPKLLECEISQGNKLESIFPALSTEKLKLLLEKEHPNEIEQLIKVKDKPRTIRLRSQPSSSGQNMIIVCDTTSMNTEHEQTRQRGRLQLIGQLARGVAHDFNNLLCGISGYASLLSRGSSNSPEISASIDSISKEAERGIALAGHLLELCHPGLVKGSTEMVHEHVTNAINTLRDSFPTTRHIESAIDTAITPVALTGVQIEQVILNLAWLVADRSSPSSTIQVRLCRPGNDFLSTLADNYAAVIIITTDPLENTTAHKETIVHDSASDTGIIQSVIGTMLNENGGRLETLAAADGTPIYRVALPHGTMTTDKKNIDELSPELIAYIQPWILLFARPDGEYTDLDRRIKELDLKSENVNNISSALAHIEADTNLDSIILDKNFLGPEWAGLLKAILKLRPFAGIVVICEDPTEETEILSKDIIFVKAGTPADGILAAMIEARTLAFPRKNH
ncbi:MAG: hypothetical protein KAH23_00475 [Kiritimatiellae bacterium]|nr:hypothetical protein [Kiritimatiellia bacterium]